MTKDEICEKAMMIIANSGNSRSLAKEAIKKAKNFNFTKAYDLMDESKKSFYEAHNIQTELISESLKKEDEDIEINLLMVHAQDHLTMATIQLDFSNEIIELYNLYRKE